MAEILTPPTAAEVREYASAHGVSMMDSSRVLKAQYDERCRRYVLRKMLSSVGEADTVEDLKMVLTRICVEIWGPA